MTSGWASLKCDLTATNIFPPGWRTLRQRQWRQQQQIQQQQSNKDNNNDVLWVGLTQMWPDWWRQQQQIQRQQSNKDNKKMTSGWGSRQWQQTQQQRITQEWPDRYQYILPAWLAHLEDNNNEDNNKRNDNKHNANEDQWASLKYDLTATNIFYLPACLAHPGLTQSWIWISIIQIWFCFVHQTQRKASSCTRP